MSKWKLTALVFSIVVLGILVTIVGLNYVQQSSFERLSQIHTSSSTNPNAENSGSKPDSETSSSVKTREDRERREINEKNYQDAIDTIEMPNQKADVVMSQKVKNAFQVVYIECLTAKNLEIDFSMDKHLHMATRDIVRSFAISLQHNGYTVNPQSIEVYESSVSDIVQFVAKATHPTEEDMYWTANYNTIADQVIMLDWFGGTVGRAFG